MIANRGEGIKKWEIRNWEECYVWIKDREEKWKAETKERIRLGLRV
jgi:hypothetical protein